MSVDGRPVGIVVGMSPDRVIGRDNRIPWRRPADLRRFQALTWGGTLVMGRLTWLSIGRALPGRTSVVLTSSRADSISDDAVLTARTLDEALCLGAGPVWIIGGARVFAEALERPETDFVDLTHVPDRVPVEGSVLFPRVDPERWTAGRLEPNPDDADLWHQRLERNR